jgi:hypothetical protein
MTTVQRVAQIFGVVFILLALLGFFQGMSMESSLLLGLFPVNLLHNVVHLLFGLWGLLASRTFAGAKTYAQVGGVVYLLLAVVGFVDPSGFGLVPLGGNDIWLHAVIGLVLAGVGFTAKETAPAPKAA